jgi:hypothetical protein
MAHVLARLAGVKLVDARQQLEKDASAHAEQGMYLEHLWANSEDPGEVLFLFRVDDLNHCRQRMRKVHAEARRADPNARLPEVFFLAEV